jgi:dipeptidyl aminopeptidase/acylaminoacyl peptidase
MKKIFLTIVIVLLGITNTRAQIAGSWKGELNVQGTKLPLVFNIKEETGKLTSSMDSPSQGAMGIAMDKTVYENSVLTIEFIKAGMKFVGKSDKNEIKGTFYQSGTEFPLNLSKITVTKPGNTTLPSSEEDLKQLASFDNGNYKYRVEDYFTKPKLSGFQLSPQGKYLCFKEKDSKSKNHLYIKNTTTNKITLVLEEKEELIKSVFWINEERLIYRMDKGGNENFHIYAVNIDGTNIVDLTPYDGVQATIIKTLPDQKDFVIVEMNKENAKIKLPYKINVNTGEFEKLFSNDDATNPTSNYKFDQTGVLRSYTKTVNGVEIETYYKNYDSNDFKLLYKANWKTMYSIIEFNYATENKDDAYVLTNIDSDKNRFVLYDLKENKLIKEIYSNNTYDVSGLVLSRKRNYEIDYLGYYGEKAVIEPVSKTYKSLHSIWSNEFKGYQFNVVGLTDNEDKYLLVVSSDKLVGKYYIYDTKTKKTSLLFDLMPQLIENEMASVMPITFKSRDGLTVHGYITLPKGVQNGNKVPLIVNPHGGPANYRDYWGFNPEAQLFASRGYATLHVNFRISGGYGKSFLEAGYKQIGRKVMDDIEDGVQYAIEQGYIDKNNVAIYGASHGGYATLMGLVKTPELYKCGVDYIGVSNIETVFKTFPTYWEQYKAMLNEQWYDLNNPEELKIAKSVSAINNIEKINKPLFVVQGANDPRVNINESDQIVTALRAKGFELPYMVKYNEGHGFLREENTIDFYKSMMGFFAKNLKSN